MLVHAEAAPLPLTERIQTLMLSYLDLSEPSDVDLVAIESEWPLIAAELDVLDAEIAVIYAEDRGGPTDLDWRRLRRAQSRVLRTAATLAAPARQRPAA